MTNRYQPHGILALAPQAYGLDVPDLPKAKIRSVDGVSVVTIRGPLVQHAEDGPWDSYESISARVTEALASNPRGIVLRIDSPGGVVAGCFETARAIRERVSGVPLVAYVEGQATSAAYALACVADTVITSPTGSVGSIGVMGALVDTTAADAAMGVRFALVGSGARKLDGNPHAALTEDAIAAAQITVDGMAALFFQHVHDHRPGLPTDAIAGLQAGVFFGAGAVGLGLADSVGTLDDAIALAAGAMTDTGSTETTEGAMASNFDEAIASLRNAAEGDDEEAARARRMLAAMDEDEARAEGDEPADEDEARAEGDEPSDEDEARAEGDDDGDEMKALSARVLAAEKRALVASRPDLSAGLRAAVMDPTVSLAAAERIVAATPRAVRAPAVDVTPAATRGADTGHEHAPTARSDRAADLDAAFGLAPKASGGVVRKNNVVRFGHGKVN